MRADALAGLTGAIVVLPQGVAFATLAGMPPEYGLYGAMVPCVVAALFGSSRLMVTGPATAISLTTLALIAPLATPGSPHYIALVLTLTFLVGALQLALGLARAGRLIDFVPHSVIVGFTAGAAILIINSQIGPFLGTRSAARHQRHRQRSRSSGEMAQHQSCRAAGGRADDRRSARLAAAESLGSRDACRCCSGSAAAWLLAQQCRSGRVADGGSTARRVAAAIDARSVARHDARAVRRNDGDDIARVD